MASKAVKKAGDMVFLEMTWPGICDAYERRGIRVVRNRAFTKKKLIAALAQEFIDGQPEERNLVTRFIVGHRVEIEDGRFRIFYSGDLVARGKCNPVEGPRDVFLRAMADDPDVACVNQPIYNSTIAFQQVTARNKLHTVFIRWATLEIGASDSNIDSYWLKHKAINASHTRIYQFEHSKPKVLIANEFCFFPDGMHEPCKTIGGPPFIEMEQHLKAMGISYRYL